MLIDLRAKLEQPEVAELIELSVLPDPEKLPEVIEAYRTDNRLDMMGYVNEEQLIGIVGYEVNEDNVLKINHLAIAPEERGKGFGRMAVLELLDWEAPDVILAETDEESVEFFRNIGFVIESLGESVPGIERFKCTYTVNIEE
ncbi:GNAT family N-acetyltransferase [Cohnella sp. AR92]|uniref:GNAT family N-acetyltransferase n=1 Tax=Cohnella sp. AR92 TaxID=648716 RepID=UPI000F8DEE24|nr:GNAT family N-acetyltransferase [Cohnella sp. AR92]RUS46236.1 N-acetyltransferase [Cohnella sp. AR92]